MGHPSPPRQRSLLLHLLLLLLLLLTIIATTPPPPTTATTTPAASSTTTTTATAILTVSSPQHFIPELCCYVWAVAEAFHRFPCWPVVGCSRLEQAGARLFFVARTLVLGFGQYTICRNLCFAWTPKVCRIIAVLGLGLLFYLLLGI